MNGERISSLSLHFGTSEMSIVRFLRIHFDQQENRDLSHFEESAESNKRNRKLL